MPLNPFVDNPDEEEPSVDLSKPRKVHYHCKWQNTQNAVHWVSLARAQDKGLRFWQTRSHAVIVYTSVPADCYKVISQKGDRILRYRLSTPRLAPKTVLKSSWQTQQQQDTSESAPSHTWRKVDREQKEDQGNPRKLYAQDESTFEKEPECKADLRIEGIAHDVTLKDEERMGKIQEVAEN